MKFIVLAACILGMAISAPLDIFEEFDIHFAPPEAAYAIPAGVPLDTLEVLLPVDAQKNRLGGPARGFIKQEIRNPNGIGSKELYFPFGFIVPNPAVAAPVAPVDPIVPVVPVVPEVAVVPVVPVAPAVPLTPVVAQPVNDDDENDD